MPAYGWLGVLTLLEREGYTLGETSMHLSRSWCSRTPDTDSTAADMMSNGRRSAASGVSIYRWQACRSKAVGRWQIPVALPVLHPHCGLLVGSYLN